MFCRDHPEATQQMNDLIIAKVSAALKGHWANPDLVLNHNHVVTDIHLTPEAVCKHIFFLPQVSSLQYEMLLLTDSIAKEGGCWELRLRCGECIPPVYSQNYKSTPM